MRGVSTKRFESGRKSDRCGTLDGRKPARVGKWLEDNLLFLSRSSVVWRSSCTSLENDNGSNCLVTCH
jgi:hypothetical protein